ncbi:head GIN domain-containing protein [Sphingopyxis solisilvae]|uniref:head GIN domain-containing protein n=1 Tax=Sphingopyxis solisilvae TaxID=1886788 RepID=UPI001892BADA|nr:head GIN domain-containing protein [Sphingopyxis solisilvae]
MRNRTMAIAPLALAMTVAACTAAERQESEPRGRSENTRAADNAAVAIRNFAFTGFTGVKVTGPDDVTIRRGDAFSISAKGPQSALDELEVDMDGDTLSIGRKREGFSFSNRGNDKIAITITLPRLAAVRLTGSGSVDADSIDGDAVEAVLTGSGDLKIASMTGKTAKLSVSGSGDIEIAGGRIDNGKYSVTGSGDIDAEGLVARTLDVSVTGSGNVDSQATGNADVSILGSGDVTLGGGAKCASRKVGSGTVTCK